MANHLQATTRNLRLHSLNGSAVSAGASPHPSLSAAVEGWAVRYRGLGGASVEVIVSQIVLAMPDDHAQSRTRSHARYPAATPSYARQNAGHHTGTPGFAIS